MDLYIPSSNGVSGEVSRGGIVKRATAYEVDLLARLITAEADAEPFAGKLAVGAVVLNRTRDANFQKSIYEVIYKYDDGTYQFEPVMNGWIERPATTDSIRAAKAALNGWDPTNGAVYFFATYVTNPWLWSRPLSCFIGDVAFTY
jgi:spore germination cell wall hydrolase CwlJ-like protein